MKDTISGMISGGITTIISHPLDTLKTRYQSNIYLSKDIKYNKLFAGLKYPFYSNIIFNGYLFGLNSYINNYTNNNFISGFITGTTFSLFVNPIELYKIREQNNVKDSLNTNLKSQFRGISMTFFRESIGTSIYFGIYYHFKNKLEYNSFNAGGIAGICSWSITYPFDVIKTRLQSNSKIYIKDAVKIGNLYSGFKFCIIRAYFVNSFTFYFYDKIRDII